MRICGAGAQKRNQNMRGEPRTRFDEMEETVLKILVTGGTGYIGSHTCVELLNKGYEVVVFDNLYNSKIDVVDKIEKITGKKITFYKADMLDKESMRPIFEEHRN